MYQDYIEADRKRKEKDEERKQSSQILEERMRQPLQGNLALNFLFKDQDLSEIIRMRVNDGTPTQTSNGKESFIRVSEAMPSNSSRDSVLSSGDMMVEVE